VICPVRFRTMLMKDRLTIKQKKAMEIMSRNGGVASSAMLEAGYAPASAKNPKNLTDSVGFKSIADQMSNEFLVKKHTDLLKQKQLNYFIFNKDMSDEEIKEHLLANGLVTVVIRPSDKGKMAFYSVDDSQAIGKGLDMAYKLKGAYAAEKHEITVPKPIMEVD
jgi:hypothetical protein